MKTMGEPSQYRSLSGIFETGLEAKVKPKDCGGLSAGDDNYDEELPR